MVLPVIAGRAAMAWGARALGPTAARSEASTIMRTGKGTTDALKKMDEMKGYMQTTNKLLARMERSSPLLHQNMIVLRKSFDLYLRPIGDIMGRFLRPMAIMFLRGATWWYKLFGSGSGTTDVKDEMKQLNEQIAIGQATGNQQLVADSVERIGQLEKERVDQYNELTKMHIQTYAELKIELEKQAASGIKLGEVMQNMVDWLNAPPAIPVTVTIDNKTNTGASSSIGGPKYISGSYAAISGEAFVPKTTPTVANPSIPSGYTAPTAAQEVQTLKNTGILPKSIIPGMATGGYVPETGMYQLHAGERINSAGENRRKAQAQSMNVSNYYNIQASVKSDFDIRDLARKLADLQETELRRRVSYL